MPASIHQLPTGKQDEKYKPLIGKIRQEVNQQLTLLITSMFNGADDTLFRLAETAGSNEDQNLYFETMRQLRMQKNNITSVWYERLDELLTPANGPGSDKTGETQYGDEELSLVDQEAMEELVAISSMSSKAENRYSEALSHLDARLEHLSLQTTHVFDREALAPKSLCETFQQSLAPAELEIKNKLILYKLFDTVVASELDSLYKNVNEILIDAGILPQFKLGARIPHNPVHQSPAPIEKNAIPVGYAELTATPGSGLAPNYTAGANSSLTMPHGQVISGQEASNIINQYIHGTSYKGPGTTVVPEASAHEYGRDDIFMALNQLQASYDCSSTGHNDVEDFKKALLKSISASHGGNITKQVNQIDEKTIDFIDMLFAELIENSQISDAIKTLILRLQIPVIKIAMLDETFFQDPQHHARQLLDLIARLGMGVSDHDDSLYQSLEKIVNQILADFDTDASTFQQALDAINALIYEEDSLAQQTESDTQAQILQAHSRQVVLNELRKIIQGNSLPDAVHPLVLKQMATLLFQYYMRFGRGSAQWRLGIDTVRRIVNSVQPYASYKDKQRLLNKQNELIGTIRESLYETNKSHQDVDGAIEGLQTSYAELVAAAVPAHELEKDQNKEPVSATQFDVDTLAKFTDTGAFDILPVSKDEASSQPDSSQIDLDRLPSAVKPGVWFEIFNGQDQPIRRLKLSVIVMEDARLVFVDRRGVKILEKEASEFADELAAGKSRVIADHSAFDHALGSVIASIHSNNNPPGGGLADHRPVGQPGTA